MFSSRTTRDRLSGQRPLQDRYSADVSFLIQEPAEAYHAKTGEYLTSHLLGDFRRCPVLYHRKRQGLVTEREDRPAYLVGRAAHSVILEGEEAFSQRYAVGGPVNPQTGLPFGPQTKAAQQWSKEQKKEIITAEQLYQVNRMADSVRRHDRASQLLASGYPERVVRSVYLTEKCQIRMDWFDPHVGIVDLKTCDDVDWFEADARVYRYLHQLAFYRAVLATVIGLYVPCHFIAVEKKEPFRCGVWLIAPSVMAVSQRQNEAFIQALSVCQAFNSWHTGYEATREFDQL